VLLPIILEGEPTLSKVQYSSSSLRDAFGVWKVSSWWEIPFALLSSKLLDVFQAPSILNLWKAFLYVVNY